MQCTGYKRTTVMAESGQPQWAFLSIINDVYFMAGENNGITLTVPTEKEVLMVIT